MGHNSPLLPEKQEKQNTIFSPGKQVTLAVPLIGRNMTFYKRKLIIFHLWYKLFSRGSHES